MADIKIYTTPTCHYCKMAKEFFKKHKIKYNEYNVADNARKRAEMIALSSQMGVPVIIVGNRDAIVGFDERKLKELLNITDEKTNTDD